MVYLNVRAYISYWNDLRIISERHMEVNSNTVCLLKKNFIIIDKNKLFTIIDVMKYIMAGRLLIKTLILYDVIEYDDLKGRTKVK